MNKHFFLNKWMKKLPHTLAGRVFGFTFFALMIVGGMFGNAPTAHAQASISLATFTAGGPGQNGNYAWTVAITTTDITAGETLMAVLAEAVPGGTPQIVGTPQSLVAGSAGPNQTQYASGSILLPQTSYALTVQHGPSGAMQTLTINTPAAGGAITYSQGNGNTAIGGTDPNAATGGASQNGTQGPQAQTLPKCWDGGFSMPSIQGCISQLIYYLIFVPTSFMLAISGQFMDFLLAYTLDSGSYSMGNFVGQGWKLVRDLTNILFIFVLVSIGIGTILGNGSLGDKKLIGWVIIVALLINFSLFFTKVIIDAGNILGTVFYSAMGVKESDTANNATSLDDKLASARKKSISTAIVSKFNPQTLFANADKYRIRVPGLTGAEDQVVDAAPPAGWFTVLSLILSVINVVTAYAFFVVGLLFVGRVIGLWMAMILSPLAFMSLAVPSYMGFLFSEYKFGSWAEKVAKLSFSAPVFLFFLYIILSFLNQGFLEQALSVSSNMTTTEKFLSTLIPFVIITMLILKAKDVTVKMSDEIGKKFASWGEGLGSLAVGGVLAAGTGGAALAMRGTLGRGAAALGRSEFLQTSKSKNGFGGMVSRLALRGTDKLSKASFDARNTSAADMLKSSPLKIDLKRNAIGNAIIGTDDKNRGVFGSTKDGIQGFEKRTNEDIVKEAEERQLKDGALIRQNQRRETYNQALAAATKSDKEAQIAKIISTPAYIIKENIALSAKQREAQKAGIPFDKDSAREEFKKDYFEKNSVNNFDEKEFRKTYESQNGSTSTLSGQEFNTKAVKDFKDAVGRGNFGTGGAIKESLGIDSNKINIPGYVGPGVAGATAVIGGMAAFTPLATGAAIASGVGGFDERRQKGAIGAIDKKFNNKDLESLTKELKKIDDQIKEYLNIDDAAMKNISDFDKQTRLSVIKKDKEAELRRISFERDAANEEFKQEPVGSPQKAILKANLLAFDEQKSTLRDEIDSLKNLFERREKKIEQKEKIEGKINPKDKPSDDGKKDDKK